MSTDKSGRMPNMQPALQQLAHIQHRPFVFLDVETTGGSSQNHRIIEIGALRVERNQVVQTYSQLIYPDEPIPYFITNITGINDETVDSSPQFTAVLPELKLLLKEAVFIAHNVNFDYQFLKQEFSRAGERFAMDRLCTVKLSRALHRQHRRHNLDSIIARQGYKVKNRHRALDDAEVLYKFYLDLLISHGPRLYAVMNRLMTRSVTSHL